MAAKIKDGLFIGDADTSQSEVFINDNKISNLINLSGRDVQNIWASHGLVYLTYYWEDRSDFKLFLNHEDSILVDIIEFIDVSISHGISVLLFSRNGTGRCVVAACLYLMVKYRWGFEKTYDFVYSKKPDIDLNKGFIQQMFALDMKLLASRQKLLSFKNGVENDFKIEANMTISDIAAMLPVNEAKRWNAWDIEYLKADKNDENNHSAVSLQQKAADIEEETVLICSFVNSKNTISALPGPYRNAYDIPKIFTLKFSHNLCLEEDIHIFPTSPPNVRSGYFSLPKPILKGGVLNAAYKKKPSIQTNQSTAHSAPMAQPKAQMGGQDRSAKNVDRPNENSFEEKSASTTFAKYDSKAIPAPQPQPHDYSHSDSPRDDKTYDMGSSQSAVTNSSGHSDRHGARSNDLYGFVGLASDHPTPRRASVSEEPRPQEAPAHDKNNSRDRERGTRNRDRDQEASSQRHGVLLTAEERLRNLMESMQKQAHASHGKDSTKDRGGASTTSRMSHPSLYELANMDIKTPAVDTRTGQAPSSHSDPLSAFEMLQQQQAQQQSALRRTGTAVRARHDVVTGARSGPSAARASTGSASGSAPRKAWGSSSRPASPSSIREERPVGQVGSGSGSNSRVYRHGSPSPNSRGPMKRQPQPSARDRSSPYLGGNGAPSGSSVASISTIGSGLSSGVPNTPAYGSHDRAGSRERGQAERGQALPSKASNIRYSSPSARSGGYGDSQGTTRYASAGRDATGRASRERPEYSANASTRRTSPSPGMGSVRYGTPTGREGDGSSTSLGSGGSSRAKIGGGSRPSTPTRSWRF